MPRNTLKVRLVVDVHDTHYPQHNKPTWNVIFDFLRRNKPSEFVFGGDQFHFNSISHHTKNQPLYRLRRSYMSDIEGFNRDILTPVEKLLPRGCKKIWIIGNHERFEQDLIEEHPELEDAVNHIKLLRLVERGWQIVPLGHSHKIGKLVDIHGEVLTGIGNQAGMFPAKKAVELYACSVLAGHTHAAQSYTRVSPVDHRSKWMGWISPVACDVNPSYLRNRPTAWVNGFNVIEVFPNGNFNLYPVIVSNGQCAYGGQVYGAA